MKHDRIKIRNILKVFSVWLIRVTIMFACLSMVTLSAFLTDIQAEDILEIRSG